MQTDMLLPGTGLGIPWVLALLSFPHPAPWSPAALTIPAFCPIYLMTQLWTSTLGSAFQACPAYRDRGRELRGVGCVL